MKFTSSLILFLIALVTPSLFYELGDQPVRVLADFEAEKIVLDQGQKVKFLDKSIGNPNQWSWRFEKGLPNSSMESDPEIYYSRAGHYDVMITVSNGESTDTKVIKDYVKVKGIVHSFPFDGLMRDNVNLNRKISIGNSFQFVRDRTGATKKALFIDESSEILIKDESGFLTNELSVSFWLKTEKKMDKNIVLVEKYSGREDDFGFRVLLTDGHLSFEGRDGSDILRSSGLSMNTIDDNEWHHFAAVMTIDSRWQVWIDGILEAEQNNSHTILEHYNRADLTIGYSQKFEFDRYEGVIDELKVFNKALNMKDIVGLISH